MNASAAAASSRSRSARWILLAVAVALLALLLPAAAEAKKRPGCKPKGSRTVEANKAIRVYRISRDTGDAKVTRIYACRLKTRRRTRMSSLSDDSTYATGTLAYRIQLRGRFVAYGLTYVDDARAKFAPQEPGPPDKVVRIDITRRQARKTLAETANLSDLALTGRGAVAWIVPNAVALADAAGTRTLAAGTDIAPGSLAVSSSFVYWMQAGSAFARKLTY